MKYVESKNLKPNMRLVFTLYDDNEHVLLKANNKLTSTLINRIKQLGFDGLYIYDVGEQINYNSQILSDETRQKAISCLKNMDTDEILELACNITDELRKNDNMIFEMINLSSYDNYTYVHSINVCTISVIIGMGLNLNDDDLNKLSQAALLHDIGKIYIDKNILNKKEKLTIDEFELIKQHSKFGYDILKNNVNIPSLVRNIVYSHHENEDGTGYPRGISSEKIHKFAKIIHIADVYDALTSKRAYKKAINPAEALEYLMCNVDNMFYKPYVEIFKKYVTLYPVGIKVILSNGENAFVIKNNKSLLNRPIVKSENNEIIDLSVNNNITIVNIFDES